MYIHGMQIKNLYSYLDTNKIDGGDTTFVRFVDKNN